jgi:hypothetical protein
MDRGEFDRMQGQTLPGDALGVKLMHTKQLLEAAGPQWLTEAFHAAGSLPKDNAVIAIRKMVRRPQSHRKLNPCSVYGVNAQLPVCHLHRRTG